MMAASMPRFRHKAFAALLAAVTGALGLNRVYLGQGLWWLPLGITLGALPLLIGVRNWYQTPASSSSWRRSSPASCRPWSSP
jgi:hypothetical protein